MRNYSDDCSARVFAVVLERKAEVPQLISLEDDFLVESDFRRQSVSDCPHYSFLSVESCPRANHCALRIFESKYSALNVSHLPSFLYGHLVSNLFDIKLLDLGVHFSDHRRHGKEISRLCFAFRIC